MSSCFCRARLVHGFNEFDQHLLFPTNIFDLLSKDHDCFVYEIIFQNIDTSEVEKKYHRLGQHAYPPKLIVAILINAYSHGVFSSREIERRCRQDLAFMYISQMNCPKFRLFLWLIPTHPEMLPVIPDSIKRIKR